MSSVNVSPDASVTFPSFAVITPSLPAATAGAVYHQVLTVTGGGVPYAVVAVSNFNAGNTGLTPASIVANTTGTITINATPTAAGVFTFTVSIVDAIGATLNKTYTVTVNPALTISATIPQGTAGIAYLQMLSVLGGTTPYTTFNVTGFSAFVTELSGKRVELLKETIPSIARVGFLLNMDNPVSPAQWEATQSVAKTLGLSAEVFDVRGDLDIAGAFAEMRQRRVDALRRVQADRDAAEDAELDVRSEGAVRHPNRLGDDVLVDRAHPRKR